MNRSNIGNISTNAIQTLSVSGFTAGSLKRQLGRADQTLNNMTEEQTAAYSTNRKMECKSGNTFSTFIYGGTNRNN